MTFLCCCTFIHDIQHISQVLAFRVSYLYVHPSLPFSEQREIYVATDVRKVCLRGSLGILCHGKVGEEKEKLTRKCSLGVPKENLNCRVYSCPSFADFVNGCCRQLSLSLCVSICPSVPRTKSLSQQEGLLKARKGLRLCLNTLSDLPPTSLLGVTNHSFCPGAWMLTSRSLIQTAKINLLCCSATSESVGR